MVLKDLLAIQKIADDWNSMRRRQACKPQIFNVRIDEITEFILFYRRVHCAFNVNFKMSLIFVNFDLSNMKYFKLWGNSAGKSISISRKLMKFFFAFWNSSFFMLPFTALKSRVMIMMLIYHVGMGNWNASPPESVTK